MGTAWIHDFQEAIQSICKLQMASKFRGLFRRAKKTKELNPSNNEEQVCHSFIY